MGRPRRPYSGQEDVIPRKGFLHDDGMLLPMGTRWKTRIVAAQNWSYSTPNGFNDPMTHFQVLFALLSIDTSIELRAKYLVPWLEVSAPQFSWDAITVGKVLADLADSFRARMGEKLTILQQGRDTRGLFYVLFMSGEGVLLSQRVLDDLRKLIKAELKGRRTFRPANRVTSPLLECPSLRGEWVEEDFDATQEQD